MSAISLLASVVLASGTTPYPVESVWRSFVSFCDAHEGQPSGWVQVQPELGTSLYYFARDPLARFTGVEGKPADVFSTTVSSRTLYAFKRNSPTTSQRSTYCQLYDFQATERLDVNVWSSVVGAFSAVEDREFTQEMKFDAGDTALTAHGSITFHQDGYFPPPDSIGFTGIQLLAVTKGIE